jgi:hypothetical protein
VKTANDAARRNEMTSDSIENTILAPVADEARGKRRPGKKAKATKKPAAAKKSKPKAERANKKAEVISLMKRAKGATLDEIMKATYWQAHTVRGFISILGKRGGEKIESTRPRTARGRTGSSSRSFIKSKTPLPIPAGRRFCICRLHCSASDVTGSRQRDRHRA